MSWLKYLWATLIGFVVTIAFATSSATLILWLDLSRYVERSCANNPMTTCSAWAEIGYGIQIITVCILIGLFVGTFVGTEHIANLEQIVYTIFHCQLSQASGGGRTFRALRIPVIRSARNECSTSSRRRIVHG